MTALLGSGFEVRTTQLVELFSGLRKMATLPTSPDEGDVRTNFDKLIFLWSHKFSSCLVTGLVPYYSGGCKKAQCGLEVKISSANMTLSKYRHSDGCFSSAIHLDQ